MFVERATFSLQDACRLRGASSDRQHSRPGWIQLMGSEQHLKLTEALQRLRDGNDEAEQKVLDLVYQELRDIAHRQLRRERQGHTLQTTALVHECYLRLFQGCEMHWQNRAHFFGAAARSIRRILVDHARGRDRIKRGGNRLRVELEESLIHEESTSTPLDMVALDEALDRLQQRDRRKAEVVHHLFFLQMSPADSAELLSVSPRTVRNDWHFARAWLRRELGATDQDTKIS